MPFKPDFVGNSDWSISSKGITRHLMYGFSDWLMLINFEIDFQMNANERYSIVKYSGEASPTI